MTVDALSLSFRINSDSLTDGFDRDEKVIVFVADGRNFDAVDCGNYLFVHIAIVNGELFAANIANNSISRKYFTFLCKKSPTEADGDVATGRKEFFINWMCGQLFLFSSLDTL